MSNYMLISLILPNGKYTTEKDCATYVPRVYAYALHQSLCFSFYLAQNAYLKQLRVVPHSDISEKSTKDFNQYKKS